MAKNLGLDISKLCTPASLYFIISMITYVVLLIQNIGGNIGEYCVGDLTCNLGGIDLFIVFAVKLVYIIFWSWILDLICKAGYSSISWLLVLLPIILYFLLIALFFLDRQTASKQKEGMRVGFDIPVPKWIVNSTGKYNRGYQLGGFEPAYGAGIFRW